MNYEYSQPGRGFSGLGFQVPGAPAFHKADTSPAADEQRIQILKAMGYDEGMLKDFFQGRQAFNTFKGDLRGALGDKILHPGSSGQFDSAADRFKSAFKARDVEAGIKPSSGLSTGAAEGADAGTGEGITGIPTSAKAAALKSL